MNTIRTPSIWGVDQEFCDSVPGSIDPFPGFRRSEKVRNMQFDFLLLKFKRSDRQMRRNSSWTSLYQRFNARSFTLNNHYVWFDRSDKRRIVSNVKPTISAEFMPTSIPRVRFSPQMSYEAHFARNWHNFWFRGEISGEFCHWNHSQFKVTIRFINENHIIDVWLFLPQRESVHFDRVLSGMQTMR